MSFDVNGDALHITVTQQPTDTEKFQNQPQSPVLNTAIPLSTFKLVTASYSSSVNFWSL